MVFPIEIDGFEIVCIKVRFACPFRGDMFINSILSRLLVVTLSLNLICSVQSDCLGAIQAWSINPAVKVFHNTHKPADGKLRISVRMATGEYEEAQIVIRPDRDISTVSVRLRNLTAANGIQFSASNVRYRFVGTTRILKSSPVASLPDLLCKPPAEVPDVLLEKARISVKEGYTQAIWFTFHTPKETPAGKYSGHFAVIADGMELRIPVELEVLPFEIPAKRHLFVSNWFNYKVFADTYRVGLWSDKFFDLIALYAKNMADHRINVLQAEAPYWGGPLDNTIDFYLNDKSELECDFTKCDRLIDLMMNAGVKDRVEFFFNATFESWAKPEVLLRKIWARPRKGGELVELSPDKGLRPYLQQLEQHLAQKGWLDRTMIHVSDEPIGKNFDSWIAASRFLHSAAPNLRRIEAVCTIGFDDDLEVHVAKLNDYFTWQEYYQNLGLQNKEIWFYTCNQPWGHELPNRFLDQPLIYVRLLPWLNWHT